MAATTAERELRPLNIRFSDQDKKLLTHKLEQESFAQRHDAMNKRLEKTLAKLAASFKATKEPPDPPAVATTKRGWKLPPSLIQAPPAVALKAFPCLGIDPPRFDGENTVEWIRDMQIYYNHRYTPLSDRLYLTTYLFDHPASDWMAHWKINNAEKGWDDFLLAVKQRFDPDTYDDSVRRLAPLRQRATPFPKPHTSTSDLLTRSEAPSLETKAIDAGHSSIESKGPFPAFSSSADAARASQSVSNHATPPPMQQHATSSSTLPLFQAAAVLKDGTTLDVPSDETLEDIVKNNDELPQVFVLPDHDMAPSSMTVDQPNFSSEFNDFIDAKVGDNGFPLLVDPAQLGEVPLAMLFQHRVCLMVIEKCTGRKYPWLMAARSLHEITHCIWVEILP